MTNIYRGRIAPTPTGLLHLGHARTFWIAQMRAHARGGQLIYRDEDLDPIRCQTVYAEAAVSDLQWFGIDWQEGPDCGGPYGPYRQSARHDLYVEAWRALYLSGCIYPCQLSRKDVVASAHAPHSAIGHEPIVSPKMRPDKTTGQDYDIPGSTNWRYKVDEGTAVRFHDGRLGTQRFQPQIDFGDFLVWRKDGTPTYELAVVVDDIAMKISEVVRGEDLLLSTARQLCIYNALGASAPEFYHTELVCDDDGKRLAKRHQSMSLSELRERGATPEQLRSELGL